MNSNVTPKRGMKRVICWSVACLFAVFLIAINLYRIFDNNFWADEVYSIFMARRGFCDVFVGSLSDSHPPLYYLLLKLICTIFGESPYVYHFASIIPYIAIMVIALTWVWKRFGMGTTLILMTLASLLFSSVTYVVEVRMYEWGVLWILLCFLLLFEIINQNKRRYFVFFSGTALFAAYTHYFCLVSVAFLFLMLIIYSIWKRGSFLRRTLISSVCTIILYLPWMIPFLNRAKGKADGFWLTEPATFMECIKYIFDGKAAYVWVGILVIGIIVYLIRHRFTFESFWVISGIVAILGTILTGIILSVALRPILLLRYIYPVTVIAWLLLGYVISDIKFGQWIAVGVTVVFLGLLLPTFKYTLECEAKQRETLDQTVAVIDAVKDDAKAIVTDEEQFPLLLRYYCDDSRCVEIKDYASDYSGGVLVLLTKEPDNQDIAQMRLKDATPIIEKGYLGTNAVYAYMVY